MKDDARLNFQDDLAMEKTGGKAVIVLSVSCKFFILGQI